MTTAKPGYPFDEQAALQALEHLHEQIQDARTRREQKVAEFESFVSSNRAAVQADRLAALERLEGSVRALQTAARRAERAGDLAFPPGQTDPPPLFASSASRFEPIDGLYTVEPEHNPFAVAPSMWQDRRYQIAAGAAVLLLIVLLFTRPWSGSAAVDVVPTASPPAAADAQPSGDPASAPTASPAAPTIPRALEIELTTIRPVWMRVTVDGERQIERQVPGGETLAFGADRTIVVRAGDAGAVRLAIDGADQGPLGGSGEVVNRTLTPNRR